MQNVIDDVLQDFSLKYIRMSYPLQEFMHIEHYVFLVDKTVHKFVKFDKTLHNYVYICYILLKVHGSPTFVLYELT